MSDIQVKNDNGEVEEYNKEDMTDDQRSLLNELVSLQQRCLEIEPLAREFADKKQLVDFKSKSLLESLRGVENAKKKTTAKQNQSAKRPTVEQVANSLDRHERVCEQKWKENFRRLDSIEADINTQNKRLWQIAGVVVTLLSSLVINAFFM